VKLNRIISSLLTALSLFFVTQVRCDNLNEILNQISSDLDKKKESTNAPAGTQTTRQPAQTESRSPSEPQEQPQKPKSATLQPKRASETTDRNSPGQLSPPNNPRESKDLIKAALADFDAKNYDAALSKLRAVNATMPEDAFVLNLLGAGYTKMKDYTEAQKYFGKALRNQPDFFPAKFNVGELLFLQRRYAEALKHFQQMLQRNSGNELLQFKVFLCQLLIGDDGRATETLKTIKYPGDTPAWYYAQAAWASKHGDNKKAIGYVAGAKYLFGSKTALFDETFEDLDIRLP
jgi:tetratricopeptide (TPR) repeat protein